MALVKNPLFARYFDRCGARNEERGNREFRRELLAGLSGRVLRPGGQLRFYEHVRSRDPVFAGFQQAADLVWPHLMGGCHVQRQTRAAIGRVFTIEACRGFRFPPSAVLSPVAPRVLGVARKPDSAGI